MNGRTMLRLALRALALGLLLVLAFGSLSGGLRQIPRAHTVGQQLETAVQVAAGLLSVLVVMTCFRWRRRAATVRVAWAMTLATAAGLSSLVWGPPLPLTALLFAAAALLLAAAVVAALRVTASVVGPDGSRDGTTRPGRRRWRPARPA